MLFRWQENTADLGNCTPVTTVACHAIKHVYDTKLLNIFLKKFDSFPNSFHFQLESSLPWLVQCKLSTEITEKVAASL